MIRQPMTWCSSAALLSFRDSLEELVGDASAHSSWSVELRNGHTHRGDVADDMRAALLGSSMPKRLNIEIGSRYSGGSVSFSFRAGLFTMGELDVSAPSAEWLDRNMPIVRSELKKLGPGWMWVLGTPITLLMTFIGVPLVILGLVGLLATNAPLMSLAVASVGLFFCIPIVFPRLRIRDRRPWRGRSVIAWLWTLLAGAVAGAVVSNFLSGVGK